jgi:hypothetical protein
MNRKKYPSQILVDHGVAFALPYINVCHIHTFGPLECFFSPSAKDHHLWPFKGQLFKD